MLTNDGDLTDVGSWYLGGNATGAEPEGSAAVRIYLGSSALMMGLLSSLTVVVLFF
jgi:hypothetical protein